MRSIWVVENPTATRIASSIMGDYPLRSAASLKSLTQLLRMNRRHPPSLIIVDCNGVAESLSAAISSLKSALQTGKNSHCHLILMTEHDVGTLEWSSKITILRPGIDTFHLSRLVGYIIDEIEEEQRAGERKLCYKDVTFDPSEMCLQLLHTEPMTLTPKEGRLLKMLLEMPETCISREQITSKIWPRTQVTPRTIDTHVSRLRNRLLQSEVSIESVYGGGYILK